MGRLTRVYRIIQWAYHASPPRGRSAYRLSRQGLIRSSFSCQLHEVVLMSIQHEVASTKSYARSEQALAKARESIAGGDSSSMRVLPYHMPLVADRGEGAHVWDVDGNRY